jgi:hypothetical protein
MQGMNRWQEQARFKLEWIDKRGWGDREVVGGTDAETRSGCTKESARVGGRARRDIPHENGASRSILFILISLRDSSLGQTPWSVLFLLVNLCNSPFGPPEGVPPRCGRYAGSGPSDGLGC